MLKTLSIIDYIYNQPKRHTVVKDNIYMYIYIYIPPQLVETSQRPISRGDVEVRGRGRGPDGGLSAANHRGRGHLVEGVRGATRHVILYGVLVLHFL